MGKLETRLVAIGEELPPAKPPVANYLGCKRSGNTLYVSGRVSRIRGEVGSDISLVEAQAAAKVKKAKKAKSASKKARGSKSRTPKKAVKRVTKKTQKKAASKKTRRAVGKKASKSTAKRVAKTAAKRKAAKKK